MTKGPMKPSKPSSTMMPPPKGPMPPKDPMDMRQKGAPPKGKPGKGK